MSMETRLRKFAAILRKAVNYGPDDYNPDDETTDTPEFDVGEGITDIEEIPEAEGGDPDRLELIKERHQELQRGTSAEERAKARAKERARIEEITKHRDTQEADMTVPTGPGISGVINERREELEEAIASGDADAISAAQRALDEAEDIQTSMDEGTYTPPEVERPEAEGPTETPYDRATDVAKNEEAMQEIQETIDAEDEKDKRNRERAFDIDVDDVLVLADTMYDKDKAKADLGDMDIKELHKRVLDKYNELNPEAAEAVEARAIIDSLYAQAGIVSAEKEDDPYAELKEMTMGEKIDSATYVQLYALDKLFTKQLEERKAEAEGEEDETVDPDEVQENLDKLLGKKPSEYAPGPVKKFTEDEIKAYQAELDAKEKAASVTNKKFSVREAEDHDDHDEDEIDDRPDPEDDKGAILGEGYDEPNSAKDY